MADEKLKPLTDAEIAELRKSATEPFYDSFAGTPHADLALRLLDEVTRARALLRRIEWTTAGVCPVCSAEPGDGAHREGCELAALIGGKAGTTAAWPLSARPKPGDILRFADGTEYEVGTDGVIRQMPP